MKDEVEELFDYLICKECTEHNLYSTFPSHCYKKLSAAFSDMSEVTSSFYLLDGADVQIGDSDETFSPSIFLRFDTEGSC